MQVVSEPSLVPLFHSWMNTSTSVKLSRGKISLLDSQDLSIPQFHISAETVKNFIRDFRTYGSQTLPLIDLLKFNHNLAQLNKCIEAHNTSIDNTFLKRILNFFLRFFGFELKYERFKIPDVILGSTPALQESLIRELIENSSEACISDQFCEDLYRLTRVSRLSKPLLQNVLAKLRLIWPEAESCGLDRLTTFKVTIFIESNRELICNHRIGLPSKSRSLFGIRCIKPARYNTPLLIEYDEKEKKLFIHANDLPEGGSKKPRCVIDYESNNSLVIAKIYNVRNTSSKGFKTLVDQECIFMKELKDENHIVKMLRFLDYFSEKKQMQARMMIMPFYNEGSLSSLLKNRKLARYDKLVIARDVLQGIFALRKHRIVHRDIKPGNIFVNRWSDAQGQSHYRAVIGDLGLAIKEDESNIRKNCGSKLFHSPQVLRGELQSTDSDFWALGLTLHHLLHGSFIIEGKKTTEEKLQELEELSLKSPIETRDPLLHSVLKMLVYDPKQRVSPEQIYAEVCDELKTLSF